MSINTGYKVIEPKKQMPFWLFAIICFLAVIVAGLSLYLILPKEHTVGKPYALKQNGDTLFIPTQVVVKHDTLVVIVTTERRPVQDSIDAANLVFRVDTSAMFSTYILPGGHLISNGVGEARWSKQPKTTRDTIYEHKIIYY